MKHIVGKANYLIGEKKYISKIRDGLLCKASYRVMFTSKISLMTKSICRVLENAGNQTYVLYYVDYLNEDLHTVTNVNFINIGCTKTKQLNVTYHTW